LTIKDPLQEELLVGFGHKILQVVFDQRFVLYGQRLLFDVQMRIKVHFYVVKAQAFVDVINLDAFEF
jgi:hypothetical protein